MAGNTLSDVEICNVALARLGTNPILSFSDGDIGTVCEQMYAPSRDALLRRHFWSFAIKRVALAADAQTGVFGPQNMFTLPSDFIRVKQIHQQTSDYHIEGSKIVTCQDAPLQLVYVAKVTDTSMFDPLFVDALVLSLVLRLGPRVIGEGFKSEVFERQIQEVMFSAQQADSQDSTPGDLESNTLVLGRYGYGAEQGWWGW